MKKLYDEYGNYTEKAKEIAREIDILLDGLFKKYSDFNVRELSSLIIHGTITVECETILRKGIERAKAKRKIILQKKEGAELS